jgi:hypothetical protein
MAKSPRPSESDPAAEDTVDKDARSFGIPDDFPEIVCLCGSTRFKTAFEAANKELTLAGKIVLTVGTFPWATEGQAPENVLGSAGKATVDQLHLRKIELADRVLVLNIGGYIGESTRREIQHATKLGKPIEYQEQEREEYDATEE